MPYVLALDQGTTSSRALVFDAAGRVAALAQREFRQSFPRPGWVEHDPEEIWESQLAVARLALAQLPPGATEGIAEIAAIGLTNQRETTLVWERPTGKPIFPAIVWQDRRTAGRCAELKARGLEPLVRSRTGLVLDPYFSGTKLGWILDEVPDARARAEAGELAFGTVDSWLLWKLTGGAVHATDPSNASRTLLFDLARGDWDDELLGLFSVPRAMLPAIVPSSGVIGETAPGLFGRPIPIAGVAGDQQAALFGQVCVRPGMAKCTYGTGSFLLLNTGPRPTPSAHGLLTTAAWRIGGRTDYALEGSVFIAGALVQWLRDGLGVIRSAAEVEALAASVPDAGGVVLVPAFAGLGAPHWDPRARGTILGLTRGTTAAHLARAALEAIAFQAVEVLRAMEADAGVALGELRVDGGAAANDLLLQIQADLLGVPVVRPRMLETTALGAAYLAGLAVGVWPDTEEIAAHAAVDRVFEPAMPRARAEARLARWLQAVERSKDWEEAATP
ncbi:MAG TPA: glycerol kinase GlpK [Thermoanaerobaculia bacterium]|jgi:glycerol kinase|nr:glycerol kinase GlpK [Thermoanaerobaculia bacterium]